MELLPTHLLSFFGVDLILGSYSHPKRERLSWQKRKIPVKYMHTYEAVISPTSRDGAIFSTQRHSRKIKVPEVLGTWHSTGRKTDRGEGFSGRGSPN